MFVISCEPIQYSMHPRGGWRDLTERKENAGATFVEIERQIEMPKELLCLSFQSREVLDP